MTALATYARLDRALLEAGREFGLRSSEMQVLMAVSEADGEPTTVQVAGVLRCDLAHVRRAASRLRADGFVVGESKPGTATSLALTESGASAAARARAVFDAG